MLEKLDTVASMNTISKTVITIEHHSLQLPYASLRLHQRGLLDRIVLSVEEHGQLVPVVVVSQAKNRWALMDGYLRIKALQRVGHDTVLAEVWDCDLVEALLMILTEHQSRRWEVFEEALLLQELHAQHGLSQNSLAKKMGRDQSWISRRLSLVGQLPEGILQVIARGKLSLWSATRILAPMARANAVHGTCVLNYLLKNYHSTRELKSFYDHYQQSNHAQRAKMVNDPGLFFKAQKLMVIEKQTHRLQAGPEGQWQSQLRLIIHASLQLKNLAPKVFTAHQTMHERASLVDALHSAKSHVNLLTETVRNLIDDYERHTADDYQPAPKGKQPPKHQSVA